MNLIIETLKRGKLVEKGPQLVFAARFRLVEERGLSGRPITRWVTIRVVYLSGKYPAPKYDLPPGQRVGMITAYCDGYEHCPGWVNTPVGIRRRG